MINFIYEQNLTMFLFLGRKDDVIIYLKLIGKNPEHGPYYGKEI